MLHDVGVLLLWPVIAAGGAILGWMVGAAVHAGRIYLRDRKEGVRVNTPVSSWRQRLNRPSATIGAWIIVVGIGGAIETRLLSIQLFGDQVTDKAVIERNGGFRLTPGVRDVQASIEGWQDTTFRARLVIRPQDLPTFLLSAAVSQPRASNPISDELKHKAFDHFTNRWWNPRLPPAQYEAGEATWIDWNENRTRRDRNQFMVIDESDPAQYIVWIVAYQD